MSSPIAPIDWEGSLSPSDASVKQERETSQTPSDADGEHDEDDTMTVMGEDQDDNSTPEHQPDSDQKPALTRIRLAYVEMLRHLKHAGTDGAAKASNPDIQAALKEIERMERQHFDSVAPAYARECSVTVSTAGEVSHVPDSQALTPREATAETVMESVETENNEIPNHVQTELPEDFFNASASTIDEAGNIPLWWPTAPAEQQVNTPLSFPQYPNLDLNLNLANNFPFASQPSGMTPTTGQLPTSAQMQNMPPTQAPPPYQQQRNWNNSDVADASLLVNFWANQRFGSNQSAPASAFQLNSNPNNNTNSFSAFPDNQISQSSFQNPRSNLMNSPTSARPNRSRNAQLVMATAVGLRNQMPTNEVAFPNCITRLSEHEVLNVARLNRLGFNSAQTIYQAMWPQNATNFVNEPPAGFGIQMADDFLPLELAETQHILRWLKLCRHLSNGHKISCFVAVASMDDSMIS